MIVGPAVSLDMFTGTFVGWAILSPVAKKAGWAPGKVQDWDTGSRGWIIWIGLAILLADFLFGTTYVMLTGLNSTVRSISADFDPQAHGGNLDPLQQIQQHRFGNLFYENLSESTIHISEIIKNHKIFAFILASVAAFGACIFAVQYAIPNRISTVQILAAFLASAVFSAVSVRAMGKTDNGLSGPLGEAAMNDETTQMLTCSGKLAQIILACLVSRSNPNRFVINMALSAVVEAGAVQASILLFNLKTGKLTRAEPMQQLLGHICGSIFGAVLAPWLYKLYTADLQLRNDLYQLPSAHMWLAAARLAYGTGLPPHSIEFAEIFAVLASFAAVLRIQCPDSKFVASIPASVAFSVGTCSKLFRSLN